MAANNNNTNQKRKFAKPNTVIMVGHLTRDAKESQTRDGRRMATGSIGQPDVMNPEVATYWNFIAFNDENGRGPASFLLDHCKPGTELHITGKLLQRVEKMTNSKGDEVDVRTASIRIDEVFYAGSAAPAKAEATEDEEEDEPAPVRAAAPRKGTTVPDTRPPRRSAPKAAQADDDDLPF